MFRFSFDTPQHPDDAKAYPLSLNQKTFVIHQGVVKCIATFLKENKHPAREASIPLTVPPKTGKQYFIRELSQLYHTRITDTDSDNRQVFIRFYPDLQTNILKATFYTAKTLIEAKKKLKRKQKKAELDDGPQSGDDVSESAASAAAIPRVPPSSPATVVAYPGTLFDSSAIQEKMAILHEKRRRNEQLAAELKQSQDQLIAIAASSVSFAAGCDDDTDTVKNHPDEGSTVSHSANQIR